MEVLYISYRLFRKFKFIFYDWIFQVLTLYFFKVNRVQYGIKLKSHGVPILDIWKSGRFQVGDYFSMNNGDLYNVIGRQQRCTFLVRSNAHLIIGEHVGISGTAIICTKSITIGNYVKIGGNTVLYDTDFHSIDYLARMNKDTDDLATKTAPIVIGDHVFIGAHSTILKGVSIGNNSIIGACSTVTKSIPPNEIWGGNPAKFIRALTN
jgi:acetyltransferase-like isoleucine patch superfamily enzyme